MTHDRRTVAESDGNPGEQDAVNTLLTPDGARRLRCWACGEQATDIYFLIEDDRALSVEGACAEARHDLLRQWDVAEADGDPLVHEADRLLRGRGCYGFVPVAELLEPQESADWEQHLLRTKDWGASALALLRAAAERGTKRRTTEASDELPVWPKGPYNCDRTWREPQSFSEQVVYVDRAWLTL